MIAVSSAFKNAMKQPIKELDGYIRTTGHQTTSSDDLISIKISCDSAMCKSSMRKLEAKYIGDYSYLDQWVHVGFGVKINNSFEYLDFGSFLITEITYSVEKNTTSIVGYDKMINSMENYETLNIQYPINLYDYTLALCSACNITLGNNTLPAMNTWPVSRDLWEMIDGVTYRDIIVQIAQITGSTAIISNDDKLYFKPITETNEELTYSNMLKLKLNPKYGPINSVILARSPQEDNIYMQDSESIEDYGLTEWRIENNEFVDKDRETALPDIFNLLNGIEYYPFEVDTEGLGWYEIADAISITNNSGTTYDTAIFNYSITIDGGIKESFKTVAETKTQTQYQYATKIEKRIKNTEIITNKQDGEIKALTNTTENLRDTVGNMYTKVQVNELVQKSETGLTNTFSEAGGNNIFRNTGLFAENHEDDSNINPYEFWYGLVERTKEDKASNQNALLLQDDTLYQEQTVPNGIYTVSFKYKKLIELANVKVVINDIEYNLSELTDTKFMTGEKDNDGNYITQPLEVTSQHINVKFISDIDDACEVYDLMVNAGAVALAYSQNQNETTTDTVNISKGIEINSNQTNTKFRADSDGTRVINKKNGEIVSKWTDTGSDEKELIVREKATIVNTLFQEVDDHTWITRL